MIDDSNSSSLFLAHEKRDKIKKMTLWNDTFFTVCFNIHPEVGQDMIRKALNDPAICITHARAQVSSIPALEKHGIRIDGLAFENDEKVFVLDVQIGESGMPPDRSRCIQSTLDTMLLDQGGRL